MTILLRKLTKEDVTFTLECLPEDMAIDGNASATGDETQDTETATWIREQLDSGNSWAWCCVKVVCTWQSFHSAEHLGGCAYESEESFRADGYYADMCTEALASLNRTIEKTLSELNTLVVRP